MLSGVDVVLGPLRNLVVFKSGKKSLKFDITLFGNVPAAALAYGVFTMRAGRPVSIQALGYRFDVIQANDMEAVEPNSQIPHDRALGQQGMAQKTATDKKERERDMFGAKAGADYWHFPQYRARLETMRYEVLKNAKPISELRTRNAARDTEITAWLRAHGQTDDSVVFHGLKARAQDMAVILDAKTAKVIGIAPFKPWN